MELPCLCCKEPVPEKAARLFNKVFVCPRCYEEADLYTTRVLQDLHDMARYLVPAIQQGLRVGEFDTKEHLRCTEALDRFETLVRLVDKVKEAQCPPATSTTPPTSPLSLPSGEALKPNVATLTALGGRSSPSSTG